MRPSLGLHRGIALLCRRCLNRCIVRWHYIPCFCLRNCCCLCGRGMHWRCRRLEPGFGFDIGFSCSFGSHSDGFCFGCGFDCCFRFGCGFGFNFGCGFDCGFGFGCGFDCGFGFDFGFDCGFGCGFSCGFGSRPHGCAVACLPQRRLPGGLSLAVACCPLTRKVGRDGAQREDQLHRGCLCQALHGLPLWTLTAWTPGTGAGKATVQARTRLGSHMRQGWYC
mmetsp:Transcript_38328/g.81440  ORF Transcript_38328/g.81440 Transcript_38328/m.81440 type:complete len:222 (-) Transcript_38328:114-779(-)